MNARDWFDMGFAAGGLFMVAAYLGIWWLMRDKKPGHNVGMVHPTVEFPPPPAPPGNCTICLKPRAKCSGLGPCEPTPPPPPKSLSPTIDLSPPAPTTIVNAAVRFGDLVIPDDARLKGDSNFQNQTAEYWRHRWQPPPQL